MYIRVVHKYMHINVCAARIYTYKMLLCIQACAIFMLRRVQREVEVGGVCLWVAGSYTYLYVGI